MNDAPTGSLQSRDHRARAAQRALSGYSDANPVLICADSKATYGNEEAPLLRADSCISELDAYELVDFWAVHRRLQIVLEGCHAVEKTTAFIRELSWLPEFTVVDPPEAPKKRFGRRIHSVVIDVAQPSASRRGLFGLRDQQPHIQHEADDPAGRLVESLRAAGLTPPENWGSTGAVLLSASDCVLCGVCVRSCPNEALTIHNNDGYAELRHDGDLCRGDGSCIELCPVEALTSRGPTPFEELRTRVVVAADVNACKRCGSIAIAPAKHCSTCQQRLDQPFGVILPPAAQKLLDKRRAAYLQPEE